MEFVGVVNLHGVDCELRALIDTGSGISLMCCGIYYRFLSGLALEPAIADYTTISDSRIPVLGRWGAAFTLREFPSRVLKLEFYVIPTGVFGGDLILRRNLINDERLTVVVPPSDEACVSDQGATPFVLFHDEIFKSPDRLRNGLEDTKIDFDESVKRRLVNIMLDAQRSIVPVASDDYGVTVNIKDETTFAYAPRRLTFTERRQIRDITDDLLKRGIIKTSTSPYCARIVPVKKKNGTMRRRTASNCVP